jgi:DNA modification methylase
LRNSARAAAPNVYYRRVSSQPWCAPADPEAHRAALARLERCAPGDLEPLLFRGDALQVLGALPSASIDCALTSPPYWGKREYPEGGIGQEADFRDFIGALLRVFGELKRVLKPEGSLWLNVGDSYADKALIGIPWRIALAMTDTQGWVLRNDVIWHKVKSGMDNTRDRLGNVHEHVFHFVRQPRSYHYDADAIRSRARAARVVRGAVISATGVSGVRYRRQIELSTELDEAEKASALGALEEALKEVAAGRISDFRMLIRGHQRITHSPGERVSGRARELRDQGFCVLRYHPNGSTPTDVWDILPEDTQKRAAHVAPYPIDLCRIPILATCPQGGTVLDPFCGTGTTLLAAAQLGRRSVGIDLSAEYLGAARARYASWAAARAQARVAKGGNRAMLSRSPSS